MSRLTLNESCLIDYPFPECSGQHEPRVEGDGDHVDDVLAGDGDVEDALSAELVPPPDDARVGVEGGHDPAAVLVPLGPHDDSRVFGSLPKSE